MVATRATEGRGLLGFQQENDRSFVPLGTQRYFRPVHFCEVLFKGRTPGKLRGVPVRFVCRAAPSLRPGWRRLARPKVAVYRIPTQQQTELTEETANKIANGAARLPDDWDDHLSDGDWRTEKHQNTDNE